MICAWALMKKSGNGVRGASLPDFREQLPRDPPQPLNVEDVTAAGPWNDHASLGICTRQRHGGIVTPPRDSVNPAARALPVGEGGGQRDTVFVGDASEADKLSTA